MGSRQFSQKQKMAILDSVAKIGVKQAAEVAGVHYTTVYDWRRQLNSLGKQLLFDYKPFYPGRGIQQITPEQEKVVLATWKDNPGYGPGQVRNQLRRQAIPISISTVLSIMLAQRLQGCGEEIQKKECKSFEARRPLEWTQMDILEFFINKFKVYMLMLLDDFSRFILGWRLLRETSTETVILLVQSAIDCYGKMQENTV